MTEQPGMNNPFVQSPRLETVHWRDAANGLREIAAQWDAKADAVDSICGVVCPNAFRKSRTRGRVFRR